MSSPGRWVLLLAAVAGLAAACGDAGNEPASAPTIAEAAVATAAVPPATATPATTPEATPAVEPAPLTSTVDGPEAPDFALTLGTGTDQFVLGEVNMPVYLVFWADW